MNRNEQIEDMAKVIYDEFGTMVVAEADAIAIAAHLTRNNYRKASEVIEEVRKSLPSNREFNNSEIAMGYEWALADVRKTMAELKKKYTEERTDDD